MQSSFTRINRIPFPVLPQEFMPAPLVFFVYNRPKHTKATLDALLRNTFAAKTELFVFSDGPKSAEDHLPVEEARQLLRGVSGFSAVHMVEREENIGLANSIITGITEILKTHQSVIVLEDDIVTSPHFLSYMNEALEHYRDEPSVFSVTGFLPPPRSMPIPADYPYDTWVSYSPSPWGWGTWRKCWQCVDWEMGYYEKFFANTAAQRQFDRGRPSLSAWLHMQYAGELDTWDIQFNYTHYTNNAYAITPIKSLTKHIGSDGSGVHCKPYPKVEHSRLDKTWQPRIFCPVTPPDADMKTAFRRVYCGGRYYFSLARLCRNALHKILRSPSQCMQLAWCLTAVITKVVIYRIAHYKQQADILLVNTEQKAGGAGRASDRLFSAIRSHLPKARYLTLFKEDADPAILGAVISARGKQTVVKYLHKIEQRLLKRHYRESGLFTPAAISNPIRIPLARFQPKLVHLNCLRDMVDIEEIGRLHCPVVWTLHDMWAFTGGCHYTGSCNGYQKECGSCPVLDSHDPHDLSYQVLQRKLRAFAELDLTIIAPSRWIAEQRARQSRLFAEKRIEVIPNGIDTELFKPTDSAVARQHWGLTDDRPVLLFGASDWGDKRKGADIIHGALCVLNMPATLLLLGLDGALPPWRRPPPGIVVRSLKQPDDDNALALAFSAADVFLHPSREDITPNMTQEAMACGTPTVAFLRGSLPELIDHQENGWLAKSPSRKDMAEGIRWVLTHPNRYALREKAREKALAEFDLTRSAKQHMALYNDLLGKSRSNSVQQVGHAG